MLSVNSVLYTIDLAEVLKNKSPDCKIVLGGPGVSTFGIMGASNLGGFMVATGLADTYLAGEGEYNLVKLLNGEIDIEQNFNICPSAKVLVYTNKPEWMEWNYSPSWAKKPMNLINARYETIDEKPSFKDMKRCVFIMDGWYEWKRWFDWKRRENNKDPYYHTCLLYTSPSPRD